MSRSSSISEGRMRRMGRIYRNRRSNISKRIRNVVIRCEEGSGLKNDGTCKTNGNRSRSWSRNIGSRRKQIGKRRNGRRRNKRSSTFVDTFMGEG